jgi:parallel beta-helix repeat protein
MTPHHLQRSILAAVLLLAWPSLVHGATRYVADNGADGPFCGHTAAAACRSISQAMALAAVGDTILVGPGRYGDLNRNGVLGETGEETGAPGCGCVLAINKNVIIVSSVGAAVTVIDARYVDVATNVLLITVGGEFGRPGKGFTVTRTAASITYGIAVDSANVLVRGNIVHASHTGFAGRGNLGIFVVNDAPVRIEGNYVTNWVNGITSRGAATVSKNHVVSNQFGIVSSGGSVSGNIATDNNDGFYLSGTARATGNAAYMNEDIGIVVDRFYPFTGIVTKNNAFGSYCGFSNYGIGETLDVSKNYWGAPSGPGFLPAGQACWNYGGGPMITSPFAAKPFAVKILKP